MVIGRAFQSPYDLCSHILWHQHIVVGLNAAVVPEKVGFYAARINTGYFYSKIPHLLIQRIAESTHRELAGAIACCLLIAFQGRRGSNIDNMSASLLFHTR